MTDKVQKIREEVVVIINSINLFTPDEDGKNSSYEAGKLDVASKILQVIDSLQEEPVSEDLREASRKYFKSLKDTCFISSDIMLAFKAGAKWQKEKDYKDGLENDDFLTFAYMDGMEEGKKEMREHMIKNSIEVKVKADKDGLFTTETWDEMNELLQKIGAKEGDKVYICIIKEE